MHEHDLDLIAAAAAGDPDADQAEVARLVADCDECRREWDAQRSAIAALAAAPPAVLDDLERARLHRAVTAALGDDRPQTRPGSPPAQVSPFTRRVLAIAGAAAVVVAVLGVGTLLRDGGGDTFEQVAPEAGADVTTGDQTFDTPADAATLQGEMQIPDAGGAERSETTAAAASAETTSRAADELAAIRLPEVSASRLARRLLALRDGEIDPDMPTEETALSCLDRVEQDRPEHEIDLVALLVVGGERVEVFVVVDSAGQRVALAYRTSDCMLIAER